MKALLVFFLLALPVIAGEVHTPKVGSKERADILNAVRDPLEDQIRAPRDIFKLSEIKP